MKKMYLFIILTLSIMNVSYASNVTPVSNFNVNKYTGKWYEIARLPNRFEKNCFAPIVASYELVENKLNVINQCETSESKQYIANGVAYFVESDNIAKLKVTFLPKWLRLLPFGSGDYWVMYTDYDKFAIVGSPDHKYLWILSRAKSTDKDSFSQMIDIAKNQGFAIDELIINN